MSDFSVRLHSGGAMAPIDQVADLAERGAFAHQALAVKLRELEQANHELERAAQQRDAVLKQCKDLYDSMEAFNAALHKVIYR